MIDIRHLPNDGNRSSFEVRDGTRFIWMRVCEHCLCRSTISDGVERRCLGCRRVALLGEMEDLPP